MKLQGTLALAGLFWAGLGTAATPAPTPAPAETFLPDTAVLARVEDRAITAFRFVDAFFASDPEFRPTMDSTGRAKFLQSLVNQAVLGLVATEANRPLGFEDRLRLREESNRILSNALYQRAVLDSVTVTDADVQRAYEQCKTELRISEIVVSDEQEAHRLRREIAAGRIAFAEAARRHSTGPERARGGDRGWENRLTFSPMVLAGKVWTLRKGQMSAPLRSRDGYHIVRVEDARPYRVGAFEVVGRGLRRDLRGAAAEERAARLQRLMADEIGLATDSANVAFAARAFQLANRKDPQADDTPTLELGAVTPTFAPEDTGRVLARWRDGALSLGRFMNVYLSFSPLVRPNINDFSLFREQVVSTVLSPYMPLLAVRRGLDKDPAVVAELARREEQLRVEHLYEDSVASRVWVRPEERRAYYEKHRNLYVTYPEARFATLVRSTKAGIDSVAERLRAGAFLPDLIRADSLAGHVSGSVQSRSGGDRGTPYYKVIFEELRPGQFSVSGPDKNGDWLVIQLLEYVPERQMSYKEAEHYVDESLTNMAAEKLLDDLIARHRARFRIVTHPEKLMQVRLVDPAHES
uniref:Peptidyl-prolyl cis-trans isomerase n=1 Tax=Eiseniibacteriota bacterium TaxID=2212470 RepID=A0A832I4A8_UNCEI